MNSNLQVFKSGEFGELRVLVLGGKEYFPASECAKKLGYSDPHKAISTHCRYPVKRRVPHPQGVTSTLEVNFIPEGDLYRLIIRSKLPAAERFERWVCDEVLPTIRRTGGYVNKPDQAMQAMVRTVELMAASQQQFLDMLNDMRQWVRTFEQRQAQEGSVNHDPLTGNLGNSFITQPTLAILSIDQPSKILAAIYKWANHNQTSFYGRNNSSDFDCWGRWDKGNWQYLSFYPDKIRYLVDLYGGEPNQVLHAWRDRGWLETNNEKSRFTKTVRVGRPGNAVRLISIKRHALQKATRAASSLTGRL